MEKSLTFNDLQKRKDKVFTVNACHSYVLKDAVDVFLAFSFTVPLLRKCRITFSSYLE